MFDFGFNELLLLSILIIILFGPKELPIVLRSIHMFFSIPIKYDFKKLLFISIQVSFCAL